ncbi:NUDIX domain-containing protein [Rhodoblastus acidophilus]|uniref:GDP-mannose pyrophosphatase n=1 Tax=Candidatus Rhodoblastus alkanivorans TaxID=2954117 RepID=A0ABS9Z8P3_9HYPH|nr:NUDIX domain-containing protein [Candidatus Rhodoblastus alkanivorans]MCI4677915.1 NUDIX domain-containing protein [Candidatus Rhodoblastus alkanivorans]MCI4683811.1 NUDIX domain-containing protein [Candidatus Rhodoblastus alkanivorans]MDI4641129.1 NUDIX domain-containing protein [Rhodoblastus acidophilus]
MSHDKIPAPRGLDEKILADEKYSFSRLTYEIRRADGRWEKHERNLFRRPDACVLLPYDCARGKVLLTRQFRLGAFMNDETPGLLEACAGTLDPGESPDACMRREAMEEMGLKVGELRFLFEAFVSPAASTEKLYFFAAPYGPEARVGDGGGMEEEGEEIEVVEAAFVEVLREAEAGAIRDGKTLTLLYWLKGAGLMA